MDWKFIQIILIIFQSVFSVYAVPVKFYSINAKFGISIRETNSVCKDNKGFIWASSKTGILRLTEDDYRIYHLPYEEADAITVRLIYNHLKLIAYTNDGQIFQYDSVLDRFDLIFNLSRILKDSHLCLFNLLIDNTGAYWLATSSGLYKYWSGKLVLVDKTAIAGYSITLFDNKQLLVTKPDGIYLFDMQSLRNKCVYKNTGISSLLTSSLYFDEKQNKLWIGTLLNGLFCFNFNSNKFSHVLKSSFPKQPILAIEENSDSTLLFGIDGQGLWELNKNSDKIINVYKECADDLFSLRGNGIYDLYCEENRRVWICSISGGLSYFDQTSPLITQIVHQTNDENSLINNDVNSILEDHRGKIWFATNNGISCWDVSSNQWKNYYCNNIEQSQVFLALREDDRGNIWAGSYSSGVYVLDGKTGKQLANYSQDNMGFSSVSNFIFDIFKDSQGDIWFGGVNGEFICYQFTKNKFRTYSKEPISLFAELSTGQIILGCSYGIALLNKQTGDMKKILSGFVVQDIIVLDQFIWVCTLGDGLLKYNYKEGRTEKFTTQSGLPSNFINSIVYSNGCLWLGTENNLCRFNPEDKTVLTISSIPSLSRISYNRRSYVKLKNGKLIWGTNNGAVLFTPSSINEMPINGKIFFQDITISGRSIRDISSFNLKTPIDSLKIISMKYSQNNISMEILPIGTPAGSMFSWKMEGFDEYWTPPSENRILTYTNIPIGEYFLRIKLYNNSLSKIISERLIKIKVIPPFWRTVWFLIFFIIAILGIIALNLLYYINWLKQKYLREKIHFFINIAHDIRNSLTLIKAPIEELDRERCLTESGRDFLRLAIKQSRHLSSMVTQLLDFQKTDLKKGHIQLTMTDIVELVTNRILMFESYSKSMKIRLEFFSDKEKYVTAIDELKIEKVIDNLISNSVKYSRSDSKVQINLKCEKKKWILEVKDSGIGISRNAQCQLFKEFYRGDNAMNSKIQGSGIGLLLAKNYVTMHRGKISCESQENIGSTFRIIIPYKELPKQINMANPVSYEQPSGWMSTKYDFQIPDNHKIANGNKMKVLIVEDNDNLCDFMNTALKREFCTFIAKNGIKAQEFISNRMPDLVVSDIMMPGMDGFKLCQLIKSTYKTSHIPVILLTGLSNKTQQLYGLGLGADDYLTKPFDMNLLIQRIKTIINNRQVTRKKALKLINVDATESLLTNKFNNEFIKKITEVAIANISNSEFNKEIFASEMNVSPSLLYKKIKSLTDQSPTDFIKTIRLNHAIELLQRRKYSITEISERCGFSSVAYFSTVFKKYYGKSPIKMGE